MTPALPKIDILPEHLIDQIKAGEVIERPGNLLKEILENAVDARATKIELTLKNNGMDLISLRDNGHGMTFSDLPLAFSRHATSKISRFEDLYKLHSFGFRGEALASISAISKLQCISFTEGNEEGAELRIDGGQTIFHGTRRQSGFPHGTELVIQDLFYNTPARLKFIQSQNAEKQFIKKIIYAFILSNPQIEFHIKFDDDDKDIFPKAENLKQRIKDIIPKAQNSILYSERFYENNELELYLIPQQFKAPIKWQYVFINNRFVLDKQFHRVLTNALQASFGADDFHYIAFLNLPPDNIDVNVHPNKTVIKCMESSKLIGLLTSTIKELARGQRPERLQELPQGEEGTSFFGALESMPSLLQERHEYNMEGLFSPHGHTQSRSSLNWIAKEFILVESSERVLAYGAKKLLQKFVMKKLKANSPTIPLLVSEPFPIKGVNPEHLASLQDSGLEIEKLGPDTLVLRGIPEWMSGFPLKEIMSCIIMNESFSRLELNTSDWSNSTWEEMISAFSFEELSEEKIALNLDQLLKEKLK